MDQAQRLGSLASKAPMPVLGVDRDGRLIYANDSLCALTGYDREGIVGRFFWEFILGEDAAIRRERFLRLRDEGVDSRFDARIITSAGNELRIAWHNVSFFNGDGRLDSVFSIGADITALRRAESRLERLNVMLKALSGVSGLALRTDDPRELLDRACETLVETGACSGAWIALLGDDRRPVGLVGSCTRRGKISRTLRSALTELPDCMNRVLEEPSQVTTDAGVAFCRDCALAPLEPHVHGITTTIGHGDTIAAVLVMHLDDPQPPGQQVERLIHSIADDLGFALATLEAQAMHQRTERSLAERTRLLDAFFESSLEPTAILDRDFNFLRVNRAYADADGMEPHEFVGHNHFELYPDEENQRIFEQVRDTGEAYSAHAKPFVYPDNPERGTTYWDWTVMPISDDEGEVELLSFWLRDVTEEQRAKQQFETQRNFVDAVVRNAGSLVVVVDAQARIVRFNRTAEKVSGRSSDEVRGRDFIDTLIPAEERGRVRADFAQVLEQKLTRYETSWERADGERRRISWAISTFVGENGGEFMVGTGWDVTEERRMARELRESEEKYRGLVENAHTVIIRWDLDGRVRFMNEYGRELFGYSEDEIIGEHVGIIVPDRDSRGEDLTGLAEAIVARPEDYWVNENENIAKDGTRYWMSWSNRVLRDEFGQMTGIMAIGVDRTRQRRAEEQLEASREDLRDLTAELAMAEQRERREIATLLHDSVGQLLAFAKLKLGSIVDRDEASAVELADVLRYIDEAIGETRLLTSQLAPPVLEQLGFVAALQWLTDDFSQRHDLPISFAVEAEAEDLSEEATLTLFQSVRELITNVIKHAEAEQVLVRLSVKNDSVCIEVADDGNGFDPETLDGRKERGGGFGLFNVKERLTYLGGAITVDAAPGNGTSITLICPTVSRERATS